jgi:hypothetical protein
MFRITTNMAALSSRGAEVSRMLKQLTQTPTGPAWQPRSIGREYVIGVHAGAPATSDYRSWRFPTFISRVHAMYFELWRMFGRDEAYLFRAYFSLFRSVASNEEQELLALHCDPNEALGSPHEVYKRGPHLHLMTSSVPNPHAHIALNRCHLDDALGSVASFTNAYELAFEMIAHQILKPLIEDAAQ